ncbi:MAG: hypothetical protein J6N45_05645 [Alphaproteobacteria bacterium]|nr:hypothetical protein [Alphaproteobacteria bacterium]
MTDKTDYQTQRDLWMHKISAAEKKFAEYYDLITEIRQYYRNDKKRNKQNIFWASVETLKPFVYFKQPQPFVVRVNKNANQAQALACKILERALAWNMKQFDFDSVVKYARNDFLLSGMGILWEQYRSSFKQVGTDFIKDKEKVETTYVSPTMFLADTDKVNVWEDVEWIARRMYMNISEVAANFSAETVEKVRSQCGQNSVLTVYEIWDKPTRTIYYISPQYGADFLHIQPDVLHLSGFFPCPKPIMATLANDGIIPVPDYVEIKSLLEELDGVNNRMRLTMQALKVSGCYDNSFPELANILDKDITLISLADFDKLKDAGGIKGVIDFAPIGQYVEALQILAQRRQVLIDSIYEVTGVSDIMRGTSQRVETATAVTQKTNFGTLRNQDRQNDMQRFLKDLFAIKAEIICEHFSPEFLLSFLTAEERQNHETMIKAVQILKHDKLRGMMIDLETDGCYNQEATGQKVLDTLNDINTMIGEAMKMVSVQPALLPLYRQMIESAVATMPNARQFDVIMEQVFNKIETELNKPEPVKVENANPVVDLERQKISQDYDIKKEQNALKREELNLKKAVELNKTLKNNN